MDISSTLNQHCCFILAYSVLQFVLFVLSTQLQIFAAERILGEIKPADSLGENLHTKWSLQPPVALRARRLLHSRQNRFFLVRCPCDQAGLWNTLTTEDERPLWKLAHNGECKQSIITLYSVINHVSTHPMTDNRDQHHFRNLRWMFKPLFILNKLRIVFVLEPFIGAQLIKRHKQSWHFTGQAAEGHCTFRTSVPH